MKLFLFITFFTLQGLMSASALYAYEEDEGYSYRFLGGNNGGFNDASGLEEEAEMEGIPTETAAEIKERLQIRNVLRLVDGDAVQVAPEIRVQMIGVNMPEYDGIEGKRKYYEFADHTKDWLKKFMESPEEMIDEYDGMGSKVMYNDEEHGSYLFYYMYVPKQFLEDVRTGQLKKFDHWIKAKKTKLQAFNQKYGDENNADITGMGIEDLPDETPNSEESEFMMHEKKYYYPDGGIRREELRREGKLMLVREYDRQGNLIDEVFYEGK